MKVNLDALKRELAKEVGFNPDNKEQGLCVRCNKPVLENCHTAAGIREAQISGMCEKCFDEITKEESLGDA